MKRKFKSLSNFAEEYIEKGRKKFERIPTYGEIEEIIAEEKEFRSLSEKMMSANRVIGKGQVAWQRDIKEFIKIIEARISNQLRIHWNWLKKKNSNFVAEFVNNIINKRVGDKLNEKKI